MSAVATVAKVHPKIPTAAHLIGKKIVNVRPLSPKEIDALGWSHGLVIELEDGTLLCPQRDDEGNDAGTVSVQTPDGKTHYLVVMR